MTTRKASGTRDVPPSKRIKREVVREDVTSADEDDENDVDLSQNPGFVNPDDVSDASSKSYINPIS